MLAPSSVGLESITLLSGLPQYKHFISAAPPLLLLCFTEPFSTPYYIHFQEMRKHL
jgi:hypothetical protein